MLINNLSDALELRARMEKLQKQSQRPVNQVGIRREVRYYAYFDGVTYELQHDWVVEELEQKLKKLEKMPKKKPSFKKKSKRDYGAKP